MQLDEDIKTLIEYEKFLVDAKSEFNAPRPGDTLTIRLKAPEDPTRNYTLDIYEGANSSAVVLTLLAERKTSMQTRANSLALVRVDIGKHLAHTNPDGSIIKGSHVHIAQKQYGSRVAYPLQSDEGIMVAGTGTDIIGIFEAFREFCHIEQRLSLQWTLGA